MKIHYALLVLVLVTTPALARTSSHFNKKAVTGCTPSADPALPSCGVKDESPTYFPDKLAPTDTTKTTAAPASTSTGGKKTKHKKPLAAAPTADVSAPDPEVGTWEKGQ